MCVCVRVCVWLRSCTRYDKYQSSGKKYSHKTSIAAYSCARLAWGGVNVCVCVSESQATDRKQQAKINNMKLSVSAYRAHASAHKKILSSYQSTLNYGSTSAAAGSSSTSTTLFSVSISSAQLHCGIRNVACIVY